MGSEVIQGAAAKHLGLAISANQADVFPHSFDAFIAKVDQLGGPSEPAAQKYLESVTYHSATKVNQSLDP